MRIFCRKLKRRIDELEHRYNILERAIYQVAKELADSTSGTVSQREVEAIYNRLMGLKHEKQYSPE